MHKRIDVNSDIIRLRDAYQRRRRVQGRGSPGLEDTRRKVKTALGSIRLTNSIILDLGCSWGKWIRDYEEWGAKPENIFGVDLRLAPLARARKTWQTAKFYLAHGAALPFKKGSFDVIFVMIVFSSILNSHLRKMVAAELQRVTKPGGLIVVYDFYVKNPFNPDVRALSKKEIYDCFKDHKITLQRTTLIPPFARFVDRYSKSACRWLSKIPLLMTHYIAVIKTKKTT